MQKTRVYNNSNHFPYDIIQICSTLTEQSRSSIRICHIIDIARNMMNRIFKKKKHKSNYNRPPFG